MNIGGRIKNLRKSKGLTQTELGRAAGLSSGQISEYENDLVKPSIEKLSRIADVLSVSVAVLNPELLNIVSNTEPVKQKISKFPVISEAAAASCNTAFFPISDYATEYAEEFVSFSEGRAGDFVIKVTGDSMLPWYPQNTLILARPGERIKNGDRVLAVLADGSCVFKIFAEKNDRFFLLSLNEADGKDFEFKKTDFSAIRAMYVVIQSMRDERALDRAMTAKGIHHRWEKLLAEK